MCLLLLFGSQPASAAAVHQLRTVVAAADGLMVAGRPLRAGDDLKRFYTARSYQAAWLAAGAPRKAAYELLDVIEAVAEDGLRPADYHLDTLKWLLSQTLNSRDGYINLELELLLTDAFLALANDSAYGRAALHEPDWAVTLPKQDLPALLQRSLREERSASAIESLLPAHSAYLGLRDARRRLLAVAADGWPELPAGPVLRRGMSEPRVPILRERLRLSGDLPGNAVTDSQSFDAPLKEAVRRFQRRHGLQVDGRVGEQTRAALNVGVGQRLAQIELNMERWRRLPRDLGERHIMVNIADYSLEVVENGEVVQRQRVIVGQDARRTPVMSSRIGYLVFNPSWEIPTSIMVEDMLPQVRANPAFFERNRIDVLQGWRQERRIDPAAVDWEQVPTNPFPYRFRQAPGPYNSLGQVKFMFPNQRSIYLHDTPDRRLFERDRRAYSSGCVRVERPLELANYLIGEGGSLDRQGVLDVLVDGEERNVHLAQTVPVHLLYLTAWVDNAGVLHFRDDVYRKDTELLLVMHGMQDLPVQISSGEGMRDSADLI